MCHGSFSWRTQHVLLSKAEEVESRRVLALALQDITLLWSWYTEISNTNVFGAEGMRKWTYLDVRLWRFNRAHWWVVLSLGFRVWAIHPTPGTIFLMAFWCFIPGTHISLYQASWSLLNIHRTWNPSHRRIILVRRWSRNLCAQGLGTNNTWRRWRCVHLSLVGDGWLAGSVRGEIDGVANILTRTYALQKHCGFVFVAWLQTSK